MGVYPTTHFGIDNAHPNTGEVQRGDCQGEKQTLDCLSIVELAGFNLKTIGFVVQKVSTCAVSLRH
jgi:hypothetical protein